MRSWLTRFLTGVRKRHRSKRSPASAAHEIVSQWVDPYGYHYTANVVADGLHGISMRDLPPRISDDRIRALLVNTGSCRVQVNSDTEALELSREPEPLDAIEPGEPVSGPWDQDGLSDLGKSLAIVRASRKIDQDQLTWEYDRSTRRIFVQGFRIVQWRVLHSLLSSRVPFEVHVREGCLALGVPPSSLVDCEKAESQACELKAS